MPPTPPERASRIVEAATLLPKLRDDRQARGRWLRGARRAHIVTAILVLAGLLVVPSVTEVVANAVYPPRRSGLFRRRTRPRSDARELSSTLTYLYWGLTAAGSATLYLLALPAAFGMGKPEGGAAPRPPAPSSNAAAGPPPADTGGSLDQTVLAGDVGTGTVQAGGAVPAAPLGGGRAKVGRYTVVKELGRGAMGVVYEGHDPTLDRAVAIKELPAEVMHDQQMTARFTREARALAALLHPGIVQIFDIVQEPDGMFFVMELVLGGNLGDLLETNERLDVAHAARLGQQMAEAMAYAHEQGVVHRDFKPDNVMLTEAGAAKVTDFGLAKLDKGTKLTRAGVVMGTPAYISPEQATGEEADARADIYALGATLYEMFAGIPPFDGDSVQSILMQHITTDATPIRDHIPELPEELDALVQQMLRKDRGERPQTMGEVATVLARYAGEA